MKRIWQKSNLLSVSALLACAMLALSLVACGGSSGGNVSEQSPTPSEESTTSEADTSQPEATDAEEPEEPAVTYKLGDTVSTDLVELTPSSVQFAIALENSVPFGNDITAADDHYLQPKEYNAEEDAKNAFVASKGNVLVSIEFTVNNLDRTSQYLGDNGDLVTVTYGGKSYTEADSVEHGWYEVEEDHRSVSGTTIAYMLLMNEGPEAYRGYYEMPFEPSSLDDTFEITFNLPSVSGETVPFTFAV